MEEQIIRVLQGCAIGDAFGGGIEFKSRKWMLENVHFDKFINVRDNGENNLHPGEFTDDTEHTIAVIRTLLEPHTMEDFGPKLAQNMLNVYNEYKEKKGYARTGHGSIKNWYKGIQTLDQVRSDQSARADPGNAPVMRCLPFALIPIDDAQLIMYSAINANLTHGPHPFSTASSLLTIVAARHLLRSNVRSKNRETLIPALKEFFDGKEGIGIMQKLDEIDHLPTTFEEMTPQDFEVLLGPQPLPLSQWMRVPDLYGLPCSGLTTAYAIVWVLKNATSAFEALKWSIWMGGDVDSLAAVTVGVTAGVYGLDSIPVFMREETEGMDLLSELGTQLFKK